MRVMSRYGALCFSVPMCLSLGFFCASPSLLMFPSTFHRYCDRGGQELKNSMHYEEIGEMAGRAGGGLELKNSMHYGEIGEMRWPIRGGSGIEEFDALWRNRRNGWPGRGGVRKWRIHYIMVHYGEIGEMAGRPGGVRK